MRTLKVLYIIIKDRHVDVFSTMEESTEQSKWQTNYLEEVIRESASRLGYKELKHEQMKAIFIVCTRK